MLRRGFKSGMEDMEARTGASGQPKTGARIQGRMQALESLRLARQRNWRGMLAATYATSNGAPRKSCRH